MFNNMEIMDWRQLPKITQFYKDENGVTYRIHLYATFGQSCKCKCLFCRNSQFSSEQKIQNIKNLKKTFKKYSQYVHSLTIGGGEPLLYLDEICKLSQHIKSKRLYIITSGIRDIFLSNQKLIFNNFSNMYLSRHKANDKENQIAFNTETKLLTTDDIMNLKTWIKIRIQIVTTCFRNGGIETSEELIDFINWVSDIGLSTVIFNDLQKDVTDIEFWNNYKINDSVFNNSVATLIKKGFTKNMEIVFSGGYTITMYNGYINNKAINVGFKKYHENEEETKKMWESSKKRTFDFSLMPNGELFTDLKNKNIVKCTQLKK